MTTRIDDEPKTPIEAARKDLDTIIRGWNHVLDPIETNSGGTSTQGGIRPATEDEMDERLAPDARFDTPRTLAFWVHAALDEWPTILQTLQPDAHGKLQLVTTETIDCSDVKAMARLLHREADRIVEWDQFGRAFCEDLAALGRAVSRVAWPPKGDRLTIGTCQCGRRVRVKAPNWHRRPIEVPVPTTDPKRYAATTWIVPDDAEWEADRVKPIVCRCGLEGTIEWWREELAGPAPLLTAEELVVEIRTQLGMRYEAATVRQWSRRGMIQTRGYSKEGHAQYDRTQVLAALIAREKQRDRAS